MLSLLLDHVLLRCLKARPVINPVPFDRLRNIRALLIVQPVQHRTRCVFRQTIFSRISAVLQIAFSVLYFLLFNATHALLKV